MTKSAARAWSARRARAGPRSCSTVPRSMPAADPARAARALPGPRSRQRLEERAQAVARVWLTLPAARPPRSRAVCACSGEGEAAVHPAPRPRRRGRGRVRRHGDRPLCVPWPSLKPDAPPVLKGACLSSAGRVRADVRGPTWIAASRAASPTTGPSSRGGAPTSSSSSSCAATKDKRLPQHWQLVDCGPACSWRTHAIRGSSRASSATRGAGTSGCRCRGAGTASTCRFSSTTMLGPCRSGRVRTARFTG
jgi:hypothetical protein